MSTLINKNKKSRSTRNNQSYALLKAKDIIHRKVEENKKYRIECKEDKQHLRDMNLGHSVCCFVGRQRYFSYSDLVSLSEMLNEGTELSWSINLFSGGAWVSSSFKHLIPALTFYVAANGKYKLSLFSLNINKGENAIKV